MRPKSFAAILFVLALTALSVARVVAGSVESAEPLPCVDVACAVDQSSAAATSGPRYSGWAVFDTTKSPRISRSMSVDMKQR